MPQNPFIIATKSPSADVLVFDVSRHPSVPNEKMGCCPDHVCKGHSLEGYGLCWNANKTGHLLSGSDDAKICFWDIGECSVEACALHIWTGHADVVEDVSWHVHSPHVFGSVGDDKQILLWDTRNKGDATIKITYAHDADINTISFNPSHEFLFATGSADRTVKLWDLRSTSKDVHAMRVHQEEVYHVQWSPFNASLLASCGADRRVRIWDVAKIGTSKSPARPELLFVHGGHATKVSELSWNSAREMTLASVSEDNILQVW
eukprot:CAMPEP_0185688764 /NCGR_PEP_ID=MMETSP1164-20130828/36_1 /TAXON_ID=1104430 /ORGANISM="Chrysoreinhardia sp, Strain CCMP2950" /LENGTH=261 /DNA_ID=CAMNT_0028355225 /DNA_START=708 /DNA_END=1490 /DNA_ORIENTATION=-